MSASKKGVFQWADWPEQRFASAALPCPGCAAMWETKGQKRSGSNDCFQTRYYNKEPLCPDLLIFRPEDVLYYSSGRRHSVDLRERFGWIEASFLRCLLSQSRKCRKLGVSRVDSLENYANWKHTAKECANEGQKIEVRGSESLWLVDCPTNAPRPCISILSPFVIRGVVGWQLTIQTPANSVFSIPCPSRCPVKFSSACEVNASNIAVYLALSTLTFHVPSQVPCVCSFLFHGVSVAGGCLLIATTTWYRMCVTGSAWDFRFISENTNVEARRIVLWLFLTEEHGVSSTGRKDDKSPGDQPGGAIVWMVQCSSSRARKLSEPIFTLVSCTYVGSLFEKLNMESTHTDFSLNKWTTPANWRFTLRTTEVERRRSPRLRKRPWGTGRFVRELNIWFIPTLLPKFEK